MRIHIFGFGTPFFGFIGPQRFGGGMKLHEIKRPGRQDLPTRAVVKGTRLSNPSSGYRGSRCYQEYSALSRKTRGFMYDVGLAQPARFGANPPEKPSEMLLFVTL